MSDAQPLIESMKRIWQKYQSMPDTKELNLARLNLVACMGERMGSVLDHIAKLEAKLAELRQELSDATVWGQACDDMCAEFKVINEELKAKLAGSQPAAQQQPTDGQAEQ